MKPAQFEKYIRSLPKGAKILDAGCGKGWFLEYVRTIRPDLQFYGVDHNAADKKHAPKFFKFHVTPIEKMKMFKTNMFDCVLCFHVLEHIVDARKAVVEMHRVLKKNGLFLAECPHWITTMFPIGFNFYDDFTHVRPYSKYGLQGLLGTNHFRFEKVGIGPPHEFYQHLHGNIPFSFGMLLRRLLAFTGLYKVAVYAVARKK